VLLQEVADLAEQSLVLGEGAAAEEEQRSLPP
jgi:hypothetical protein